MSDFKAKMHQIQFRLGLCPRPRWGSLQRSPRPLAEFEGHTNKGEEGSGREGRGDLSGNVAEEAFCLKSAKKSQKQLKLYANNRTARIQATTVKSTQ